eukprot:gb/GEZN01002322.1/.p1 GENE.gb/GEZN01002322.1/~~gb/GEZN01002322.1/.p1  ORF type:complete len:826 (+),score=152.66 gb/GEZN01002322.1/:31-2508(+)
MLFRKCPSVCVVLLQRGSHGRRPVSLCAPAYLCRPSSLCAPAYFSRRSVVSRHAGLSQHAGFFQRPLSSAASGMNPLLAGPAVLPSFSVIRPQHVVPALTHAIQDAQVGFDRWEASSRSVTNFESVLDEIEQITAPLKHAWGVVSHLNMVKNSEELRSAHQEMQPAVLRFFSRVSQSKELYTSLKTIRDTPNTWAALEVAQRRIVEQAIKEMELQGVGLDTQARERFNEITVELGQLSTKYSNNVLDATKAYNLHLTEKTQVAGLPPSALSRAAAAAAAQGHTGPDGQTPTATHGPWTLTLDAPSYVSAMQHLESSALREQLYRARARLACEDHTQWDNAPVLNRILCLRQERARLLGLDNHAQVSLRSKMASSVSAVQELLDMLLEAAGSRAQQELATLTRFASASSSTASSCSSSSSTALSLCPWDVAFWSEQQKKQLYQVDDEQLRAYFPLQQVLPGLFQLTQSLFHVYIQEVPTVYFGQDLDLTANKDTTSGAVEVWHPDVRFFHVKDGSDASGPTIASFYLDPFSRPSEKQGGAWMDSCLGRSRVLGTLPVAYVVCNSSAPTVDTPALLSFREVETLFHEFGHALQHMLTTVPYADAAGISGVEWDAVELPSQFMENFCYHKPTVYSFAQHYQTKEPLPADVFDKLCKLKTYQAAMGLVRQLYFSQLDLSLHSQFDPSSQGSEDVWVLQDRLARHFLPMPPLSDDRFLCAFSHIFSGGYSAGYYSYKWAEVMSADAFEAFQEALTQAEQQTLQEQAGRPCDETATVLEQRKQQAVSRLGRDFRNSVLSLGGGVAPDEVFRRFRGRDPTPQALLKHLGLSA